MARASCKSVACHAGACAPRLPAGPGMAKETLSNTAGQACRARARRLTCRGRASQVCASYTLRRDLAEAVKVPGILGRSRPLSPEEALGRVRCAALSSHQCPLPWRCVVAGRICTFSAVLACFK